MNVDSLPQSSYPSSPPNDRDSTFTGLHHFQCHACRHVLRCFAALPLPCYMHATTAACLAELSLLAFLRPSSMPSNHALCSQARLTVGFLTGVATAAVQSWEYCHATSFLHSAQRLISTDESRSAGRAASTVKLHQCHAISVPPKLSFDVAGFSGEL
jgi:hypothetical protein